MEKHNTEDLQQTEVAEEQETEKERFVSNEEKKREQFLHKF